MQNQVTMTKVKDCKHSVPFGTDNPDAPVSTVYIKKNHKLSKASQVVLMWNEDSFTLCKLGDLS